MGGETADIRATAKYNKHTYTHTHTHTWQCSEESRIKESREEVSKWCGVCAVACTGGVLDGSDS